MNPLSEQKKQKQEGHEEAVLWMDCWAMDSNVFLLHTNKITDFHIPPWLLIPFDAQAITKAQGPETDIKQHKETLLNKQMLSVCLACCLPTYNWRTQAKKKKRGWGESSPSLQASSQWAYGHFSQKILFSSCSSEWPHLVLTLMAVGCRNLSGCFQVGSYSSGLGVRHQ